jgi:pimeloyl-ACP methyl ester carboxylesterase
MKLHFRALGEGSPLILLHGLLGSLDNWQTIARRFAGHFKVLAVDQRNHGRSPHSDDISFDAMAADLHEFMRTHGLARAHVLGHSMGGKTAMRFALCHPECVGKLVVVDVAPRAYPPRQAQTLEALLTLDLRAFHRRDQLDAELATSVDDAELRRFLLKNVGREADGAFRWKANVRGLWDNFERLAGALPDAAPFSQPALFVRGGKSDYITDADVDQIRRLFPCAQIRTIPGAGHWVQADEPDALCETVLEFLAGGGTSDPGGRKPEDRERGRTRGRTPSSAD